MERGEQIPAWLHWWSDNFGLIRDLATRQYPVHVTTFDRLLSDPAREISEVMEWLGDGDAKAATEVVNPGRRTQKDAPTPGDVVLGEPTPTVTTEVVRFTTDDQHMFHA